MKVMLGMIETSDIEVHLADGRVVKIRPDGRVSVWVSRSAGSGGYSSNTYRLTLPTFDEIATLCPNKEGDDGHGQVPWTVTHVH